MSGLSLIVWLVFVGSVLLLIRLLRLVVVGVSRLVLLLVVVGVAWSVSLLIIGLVVVIVVAWFVVVATTVVGLVVIIVVSWLVIVVIIVVAWFVVVVAITVVWLVVPKCWVVLTTLSSRFPAARRSSFAIITREFVIHLSGIMQRGYCQLARARQIATRIIGRQWTWRQITWTRSRPRSETC